MRRWAAGSMPACSSRYSGASAVKYRVQGMRPQPLPRLTKTMTGLRCGRGGAIGHSAFGPAITSSRREVGQLFDRERCGLCCTTAMAPRIRKPRAGRPRGGLPLWPRGVRIPRSGRAVAMPWSELNARLCAFSATLRTPLQRLGRYGGGSEPLGRVLTLGRSPLWSALRLDLLMPSSCTASSKRRQDDGGERQE